MPVPTLPGIKTVLLAYRNFSVLMRLDKRLAAVTALLLWGMTLMVPLVSSTTAANILSGKFLKSHGPAGAGHRTPDTSFEG